MRSIHQHIVNNIMYTTYTIYIIHYISYTHILTLPSSMIGKNLVHASLKNVALISVPALSMRSIENRVPSPLAFDHFFISALRVTRALIVHLDIEK